MDVLAAGEREREFLDGSPLFVVISSAHFPVFPYFLGRSRKPGGFIRVGVGGGSGMAFCFPFPFLMILAKGKEIIFILDCASSLLFLACRDELCSDCSDWNSIARLDEAATGGSLLSSADSAAGIGGAIVSASSEEPKAGDDGDSSSGLGDRILNPVSPGLGERRDSSVSLSQSRAGRSISAAEAVIFCCCCCFSNSGERAFDRAGVFSADMLSDFSEFSPMVSSS